MEERFCRDVSSKSRLIEDFLEPLGSVVELGLLPSPPLPPCGLPFSLLIRRETQRFERVEQGEPSGD
jgi:hypothetical protein